MRDLLLGIRIVVLRGGEARVVCSGRVIVGASRGVGEGVVGVVDPLEFLGAGGALGGVGRDAGGVG